MKVEIRYITKKKRKKKEKRKMGTIGSYNITQ